MPSLEEPAAPHLALHRDNPPFTAQITLRWPIIENMPSNNTPELFVASFDRLFRDEKTIGLEKRVERSRRVELVDGAGFLKYFQSCDDLNEKKLFFH